MDRDSIIKEAFAPRRQQVALQYAREVASDAEAYRYFDVPKSSFCRWKQVYAREGEVGLVRKKPIAKSRPRQLSPEIVEKVLHLRRTYHLEPQRITWYLERYRGVETSC